MNKKVLLNTKQGAKQRFTVKIKMNVCGSRFQGSRFFIICHIHNHTGYNR